jgi:integrase
LFVPSPKGTHHGAVYDVCREEQAGVTGLHFHDLRGTAATRAGEHGASFAEIMRLLRDKTPEAVLRYQHATDERRRMIADSMGDLMDGVPSETNVVPLPAAESH